MTALEQRQDRAPIFFPLHADRRDALYNVEIVRARNGVRKLGKGFAPLVEGLVRDPAEASCPGVGVTLPDRGEDSLLDLRRALRRPPSGMALSLGCFRVICTHE